GEVNGPDHDQDHQRQHDGELDDRGARFRSPPCAMSAVTHAYESPDHMSEPDSRVGRCEGPTTRRLLRAQQPAAPIASSIRARMGLRQRLANPRNWAGARKTSAPASD